MFTWPPLLAVSACQRPVPSTRRTRPSASEAETTLRAGDILAVLAVVHTPAAVVR
jgi:hypothetical protein